MARLFSEDDAFVTPGSGRWSLRVYMLLLPQLEDCAIGKTFWLAIIWCDFTEIPWNFQFGMFSLTSGSNLAVFIETDREATEISYFEFSDADSRNHRAAHVCEDDLMLTAVCVLAGAADGALDGASRCLPKKQWQNRWHRQQENLQQNQWHCLRRMVYPIDLRQEAHALPYNLINRLNSETEIYDTTMSMLNGCPL